MRISRLLLFVPLLLLAIACDDSHPLNCDDGSPYGLRFNNLSGRVRYYVVSEYTHGYVSSATRYDYSPEGLVTVKKEFGGGDSAVTRYTYDSAYRLANVQSDEVVAYRSWYDSRRLRHEAFYTSAGRNSGWERTFDYDSIGRIVRQTSIAIGRKDSTIRRFAYTPDGLPAGMTVVKPGGTTIVQRCNAKGMVASERVYAGSGRLLTRDTIVYRYDDYGNWVKARRLRRGHTVAVSTAKYVYYPDDERAVADISIEASDDTSQPRGMNVPGRALMAFICTLTAAFLVGIVFFANRRWPLFRDFCGVVRPNGMRRMWMYNPQPYVKVGIVTGSLLCSFVSAIALVLLFGGLVWGLFWLVRIALWAVVLVGWVLALVGVVGLLVRNGKALVALVAGIVIIHYGDTLSGWGRHLVVIGGRVLADLNVVDWTSEVLRAYGVTAFLCVAVPLGCFLALALLLIALSMLLRGVEYVVMRVYNVSRPCPYCGNKDGLVYMVNGKPYPVDLNPGVYGVFHQTCRPLGVRVPTMLVNGKARLTRLCPKCGRLVNTAHERAVGTEVHIGIVGERSSGKSYMLYSALDDMMRACSPGMRQVGAAPGGDIAAVAGRIRRGDGIQTAVHGRYKAVELMLKRRFRPVPYHLFFYDVAGENFNVRSAAGTSAMEFYGNVQSIIFIIDPSMADTSALSPSARFVAWQNAAGVASAEKYCADATLTALLRILSEVGRRPRGIDFVVACSKADTGYLAASGYGADASADDVRAFIRNDIGLVNFDNTVVATFRSVTYAAFSAVDADRSRLAALFAGVLRQRGVDVDRK